MFIRSGFCIDRVKLNYFYIKLEEIQKNLRTIRGSPLGLDLSNHSEKVPYPIHLVRLSL